MRTPLGEVRIWHVIANAVGLVGFAYLGWMFLNWLELLAGAIR